MKKEPKLKKRLNLPGEMRMSGRKVKAKSKNRLPIKKKVAAA